VRLTTRTVLLAGSKAALFLGCILGATPLVHCRCDPPHYRVAQILADSSSELVMDASIPLRDFGPKRLICLTEALKQRYGNRKVIAVSLFSSYNAARHYVPVTVEQPQHLVKWARQMHASYFVDTDKHEENLYLLPLGGGH
jgi:hypothetical protein